MLDNLYARWYRNKVDAVKGKFNKMGNSSNGAAVVKWLECYRSMDMLLLTAILPFLMTSEAKVVLVITSGLKIELSYLNSNGPHAFHSCMVPY